MSLIKLKNFTLRLWFRLTKHYPRLIPQTESEILKMKEILVVYFNVEEDRHDKWITVYSQLTAIPIKSMRISYRRLEIAATRLTTNGVAHYQKQVENAKLMAKLEEKIKEQEIEAGPAMQERTHDLQRELHVLQGPEAGMVPGLS